MVGTLNVDHIWQVPALPRPGETMLASAVERQFGGKGANQAVAAARQGAQVRLVGAVGDDAEGQRYCAQLVREGIDPSHVGRVPGVATGAAHVYVDTRGENLIVVDRGANARIDVALLDRCLADTDVLVVQLECPLAAAIAALQAAARCGVRSVLNASPTHPAFPWGAQPIDTVIVNEHECRDCFGVAPGELTALDAAARRDLLVRHAVRRVVVTQGAEPTLYFSSEETYVVPTFRVVPRDTVGAGDMFAGALAAQLARGGAWAPALWHANVAAALSTLALGAQAAMPTLAEVVAVVARGNPAASKIHSVT